MGQVMDGTNSQNGNADLRAARKAKKDCFFTTLEMIEDELRFYRPLFKGKIVYCNCDDPVHSNFWKFFHDNFPRYALKRLFATYQAAGAPSFLTAFDGGGTERVPLAGNGDFRSNECRALLDQCDICCTNPPFSLFRELVGMLVASKKEFLLVGNMNAAGYRDIYSLIMAGKIRYGASIHGGDRKFLVPCDYPLEASKGGIDEDGNRYVMVKGVRWFTNMRHGAINPPLVTRASYDPGRYARYDNFEAINVDRVKDIPMDYAGCMGVPISFLDRYDPKQFEIVGFRKGNDGKDLSINGKCPYMRVIIRRKNKCRKAA